MLRTESQATPTPDLPRESLLSDRFPRIVTRKVSRHYVTRNLAPSVQTKGRDRWLV